MHIDKHLINSDFFETLKTAVTEAFGDDLVTDIAVQYREITLTVRKRAVRDLLKFLRDDKTLGFKSLMDITAVDWMEMKDKRFEVVYHLLSYHQNARVRVKVPVIEGGLMPSATALFDGANWFEREVFDMFGIVFENHPDLRRILTDYGFEGHPLRKDFPLNGHVEVYYDADKKRVAHKPVDLPQPFRSFDKTSPWQGVGASVDKAENPNTFNAEEFN